MEGSRGGKARAKKRFEKRRADIARRAAMARWNQMTTEIAVSNRLGIALATDSAVTITGGGKVKVFDTADKLFELSSRHPVAVMFNGNMDCLGVPWEILVKEFRDIEGNRERSSIAEWADDFLSYVQNHALVSEKAIGGYVENVASREIKAVQSRFGWKIQNYVFSKGITPFDPKEFDIRRVLLETIEERQEYVAEFPVARSLENTSRQTTHDAYIDKIYEQIDKRFTGDKLTDQEVAGLVNIIIESLLRAIPSDFAAGIIVAGYGLKEVFPSLSAVEIDGRVAGRLKVIDSSHKKITDADDKGQVVYFAQTDVIERLLKGVDPEFVEKTTIFIHEAVTQVAQTIEAALRRKRISKTEVDRRKTLVREVADTVAKEFNSETAEVLRTSFSRQFDQMVAMMPKQELIELAEALVSITAVERKATSDEGTVGGPIDVAFITKHEGVVWIKRKHYFDATRNPRYFWRKYSNPMGAVTSSDNAS